MKIQITANLLDVPFRQRQGIGQLFGTQAANRRPGLCATQEPRREKDMNLINRLGIEEAAQYGCAAFNEYISHAVLT